MDHYTITVDSAALVRQADEVLARAKAVEQCFALMKAAVSRSTAYWEGDAADAHRRAYQKYMEKIEGIVGRFRDNADSLRQIAQNYAAVETETQDMAQGLPADVIF